VESDTAASAEHAAPVPATAEPPLLEPADLGAPELSVGELSVGELSVGAADLDDALFSLDDAEAWHSITLELSTEEIERLRVRAQAEGLSPEEFLRGLI
jgi:ribonuclease HI